MLERRWDVVVVGAGLAGLAAGATAARAGASVLVLDGRQAGGRARNTEVPLEGRAGTATFNGGPRALYRRAEGIEVLGRLGIRPDGPRAPNRGLAMLVADPPDREPERAGNVESPAGAGGTRGRLEPVPTGLVTLARTGLVPNRSKAALLGRLAKILTGRVRPGRPDEPALVWLSEVAGRADVLGPLVALLRVATYTADLGALSADAASLQLHHALSGGVLYLHGGWGELVDALAAAGTGSGVVIRTGDAVRRVVPADPAGDERTGAVEVHLSDSVVSAGAVVLAPGGPAAAARLLGRADPWTAQLGPPATAACLELATTARPRPRFVAGVEEPVYLSEHSPPARLAPVGVRVVHVLRYGATGSAADRAQLESLAQRVGITTSSVLARRFLHRMTVASALPSPSTGGLLGRPDVTSSGTSRVLLAGDWVGPVGLLADAALASGERAGLEAARAAGRARSGGPRRDPVPQHG